MLQNLVQLLHSIHEEIKKKFANSQLLNKIEEIFDKNLELILNYFIRCFQHTDTVKISITNNIINGLTNIQNSARILTEQYLTQEKIQDFQKSSNFFQEEEFVKLINSLSTSIKEFMKDNNSVLKIINGTTDSLNDQLSTAKTTISDLLTQLNNSLLMQNCNQMKYSQKQGGTQPTTKDKIFKDKLSSLADKIDILSSLKSNLAKNLKFVDNYCSKFYADSKGIFKQLKTLHTEKLSGIINQNIEFNQNSNNMILNENNFNAQPNNNFSNYNSNQYNNPNSDNSNYDNNNDLCNQYNNPYQENNENLFKFSNNFQNLDNAQNNSFINNNNLNNKSDNFKNFNQSENNFGNSFNSNLKNYTGNTLKKFNSHSNNKSLKKLNKSLNSSQMNNMTSTSSTNNKFLDGISPINKRKNSTGFNYNIDINEIRKNTNNNYATNNEQNLFRESRTNSNPKYSTKPFSKKNHLNSSAGKVMNISNLNIAPGTPNNFTNYNNYISQTTKNANLNKSGESFKSKGKYKSNNTSIKDYINQSTYTNIPQNSSYKNNNLNPYEFSILKKNEELSNKVNELMEEISALHQSYNNLIEEHNYLKNSFSNINNNTFNLNQNNNLELKKNSKSLNKFSSHSNKNDENNKKRKSLVNANNDFNNLCSNCLCQLNLNNNLSNSRKSNSKNRKLSGDLNNNNYNNAVNSESNETVNNNNNLNISENSCSNPNSINNNNNINPNLSASEQFYAKKNYKDKIIEIYTLSEKVLLFVDLLEKLQDEISSKSPYVKEFKVLFGETKTELVKSANESFNKAKIDLEKELNCPNNVQISLNSGALKMGILNKSMNKASTNNLTSNNSKSKINSKKGGNKRNYNSTILNYAIKKVDSNNYSSNQNQDNYIMDNHPSQANYNSKNENKNFEKNNSHNVNNSQVNYSNNQRKNISNSDMNNNNNNKRKSYLNQNLRNSTENNNASINMIDKIQESQMENMDITENEDADDYNKHNYKEEIREESNTLQNMQCDYEENLKNLNEENYYLKELNENIMKEINKLKDINSNLINENQEKGNLIEELNDKVLQINQKLVDSVNDFNNQNNENYIKIQEQESKIHELLNDLNITKLTNQALYAEFNRRDMNQPNNNENEQNDINDNEDDEEEDFDNINNKNISLNEMDMEFQNEKEGFVDSKRINEQNNFNKFNCQTNYLNSLQNKEEDEKYILNMEIEKQISENIQSQKKIDSLTNDLEKLETRYESLTKENNKTSEMFKNMKNTNADLEKSITALNKELEKANKEILMKESNYSNILSKKVKEIEELNKLIDEFKSKEKVEINNLNSKIENLEKQLSYSKDSANEMQIKIKVNKNEKESLTALMEKLNNENKNLEYKLVEMGEKLVKAENEKALLETRFFNLEKELNSLTENNKNLINEKDISLKKSNDSEAKYGSLITEKNNLEASYLKLNQEFSELKKQLNLERKENDLNSINKIMDLEAEISKLNNGNNYKETEIKLLNKKNEELKIEIKSLTKTLDNHSIESNNFKKIEENLKTEIKNLIKSEENFKAEVKLLIKKEENLTEDIKKIKNELETIKEKGKNSELLLKEKSAIIDNLKIDIDKLKGSKEELNGKIKNLCENEGILKLEIEKYIVNENTLKSEVRLMHDKENNIKKENLLLLQSEESLRAELDNLVKENKHYKELFSNFTKDENEKEKGLNTALIELENDKKGLIEKFNNVNNEYMQLKTLNEEVAKEKENLAEKLKQTEKSMKTLKFERDDFRAEVENLKVLTEDYDLKCNRIDELETKIAKLKSEIREKTNEEILKLNKVVAEKTQIIEKIQAENIKLQNENNELRTGLEIKSKANTIDENNKINSEVIEEERKSLEDKLEKMNKEADLEKENKIKLKSLNETQLNYLLRFSDKFLDINNNAIINIENINSKLSPSDFLYQIPILDIINEINFSDLKDTFQRIRSNNIVESYNAIISFFNGFFEEKILKIPDTINNNLNNIADKFIKIYQDFQTKNSSLVKFEKDFKIANEKLKNSEIEKINLTTFLDGKEQECDQLSFKLADVEKKYKNFRESQKSNIEKSESKIENLEKENNRLIEAFSKVQAELELVLDENEKLKNERDQLNNLDNIGFGHFSNSNNLLNPASSNRISDCNKDTFSHRNSNLFKLAEEAHKNLRQQPLRKTLTMNNDDIQEADYKENILNNQNNNINLDSNNNNNEKINANIINNNLKNIDIQNNIISNKNTNENKNGNNNKDYNDISNNRNLTGENELRNKLLKMEQNFNELSEENKKLKFVFDECIQMIYEAIKTFSPNLFEDPNEGYEGGSKINNTLNNQNLLTINNIPDSKGSKNSILSMNSNYSFSTDKDIIPKAVEMFKKYNKEINEKNKKLEAQVNEMELNTRTYKIMADEYKNAWELAMKKNDNIQFGNMSENVHEQADNSERPKTDFGNFTIDDLIEAGHINLDEFSKNSPRKNELLKKKISGKNINFNTLKDSNINQKYNDNINILNVNKEYNDADDFNKKQEKLVEKKEKVEITLKSEPEKKVEEKFHFENYLEKFNNPSEYKILSYKKLNNDLIWYLLISKSTLNNTCNNSNAVNKNESENKVERNFVRNTSDINELDLTMINKIKKKSSNNMLNYSSIEDANEKRNLNTNINLLKNYDFYMWVPGKLIANNLTNFEFEKNYSENQQESGRNLHSGSKDINASQKSICEKCEKSKKDINNNIQHLNELEKKYTAMLDEKDLEIKELSKTQEELKELLSKKEKDIQNYKESCDKLLKPNVDKTLNESENKFENNSNNNFNNSSSLKEKIVSLEKYEMLLNEFQEEQDKAYELMKVYEQLKIDYDNMAKKLLSLTNENNSNKNNINNKSSNNNDNKIFNNTVLDTETIEAKAMNKSFNTKSNNAFKDLNEFEALDLLEMYNRNSLGGISDLKEIAQKLNKNFNTVPTGNNVNVKTAMNSSNNMNLNTENFEGNDYTLNKADGYYTHDNIKEAVNDFEKNERLLMDQLMEIKGELKQTRNERDLLKKKYNESITLQDGKKEEILNILRSAVEKLINEIQLSPKIKELLKVILKICDFDEEQIANIFRDKEQKKKSFFGFIRK